MKILEKCQGLNEIEPPTGPTTVEGILLELACERAEQELTEMRRKESEGQLLITDPIADMQELAPLIKKHLSNLKEKHGMA